MAASVVALLAGLWLIESSSAGGFRSPEECLAYSGDAHLNCLYAYIEIQQGKLDKLQEELQNLKSSQAQLQDQVARQASLAEDLRRSLEREPRRETVPMMHVFPYFGYASGFGPGWPYGRFHYGYRFFGPCYGFGYPCW